MIEPSSRGRPCQWRSTQGGVLADPVSLGSTRKSWRHGRAAIRIAPILASHLGLHLTMASPQQRTLMPLRAAPAFSFWRGAAVCAEERPSSQAEIPSDSVLDFGELVTFEVVHRVTDEVVRVDAADLVDEDHCLLSVDLH